MLKSDLLNVGDDEDVTEDRKVKTSTFMQAPIPNEETIVRTLCTPPCILSPWIATWYNFWGYSTLWIKIPTRGVKLPFEGFCAPEIGLRLNGVNVCEEFDVC